jgi:hypothetical protein
MNSCRYSCEKCLYFTNIKQSFDRHKKTKTHCQKEKNEFQENYECENCKKTYRSNVGLWKHKKNCKVINNTVVQEPEIEDKTKLTEIISSLLTKITSQNDEIQEMKGILNNLAKLGQLVPTNNTINNTNNNKIGISIFLNEKCKNAINMSSLIQDIIIGGQDIENIEKYGYVKTITDKLVSKIGGYSVYNRPIHYFIENRNKESNENDEDSEIQDTIHIKENDIWNTESISENEILLDNLNALNGALLDKSQNKPRAIQEIKSGKHYNRTELIMKDVLQSVEINDEKLQTL